MSNPASLPLPPPSRSGGRCPFCGLPYRGNPARCGRCGTLLGEARDDLKRAGAEARRDLRFRKAQADLYFLLGLLLGGPMMGLGTQVALGSFIVLAGGIASVFRRYTPSSFFGSGLVGVLAAALAAALVVEPAKDVREEFHAGEAARLAYAGTLAEGEDAARPGGAGVVVEARGPGALILWLTVPDSWAGACGGYPPPEVRSHLAELGFVRVVVTVRGRSGSLCSFRP